MAQNLPASQNHRSVLLGTRTCSLVRGATGPHSPFVAAAHRIMAVFCMVAALLLACAVVASRPLPAHAESYTIPSVDISAQAETDGSLHVVEQRVFDFDGTFTVMKWAFNGLSSESEVAVNSVRIAPIGDDGQASGYPQVLNSVPFVLSWRDGGGPDSDAYSFDQARNTVYVFFGAANERLLIELDYTVANGVTAYSDIGEVNWRFVDGQWDADSENVTMTVSLPVPSGASVVPGENVRAWGHGSGEGMVEVNDDGSVVYEIPRVASDSFAEARVVFPSEWLVNLPSGTVQPHRTEIRLPTVLSEEEAWVDQANRSHTLSLAYLIGGVLICAVALLIGLIAYLRCGKEHEPSFKDEYWRAVPDEDVHPALIGRLWRWRHDSPDDFVVTAMRLTSLGAVKIDWSVDGGEGEGQEGDFVLALQPGARALVTDPLDAKALEILFDVVAEGGDKVGIKQISDFAKHHPLRFDEAMRIWQGLLSEKTDDQAFFERKSHAWQVRVFVLAGIAALASFASWTASGSLVPLILGILTVIGLIFLGNYMPRRSVEGNELCAKCKALRNWLRDLASLDERLPSDEAEWGRLLAYAYLFGVSDEALRGLKSKCPQMIDDVARAKDPSCAWLPWHDAAPVAAGAALRAAISRPATKRDSV